MGKGTPTVVVSQKCICPVCKTEQIATQDDFDKSWEVDSHLSPGENPHKVYCHGDRRAPREFIGEPFNVTLHTLFCQETSSGEEPDPITGEMVYDCHCGTGRFPGEH